MTKPDPTKCRVTIIRPGPSSQDASNVEMVVLDDEPTLKQLQDWVGGYIELVTIMRNGVETQVIFNEDGMSLGLPVNPTATVYFGDVIRLPPGGALGTVLMIQGKLLT